MLDAFASVEAVVVLEALEASVVELVLGAAAVPVVLVVLLAEGVAVVELALDPIALWSEVVVEAEVEGAAVVLLAL